jgi:hypothetical protein
MNPLINKLIEISDWEKRDNFYQANIKKFTEEDRLYIVENLPYKDDNQIIIGTILTKINNIEVLEKFALSGNYNQGTILCVLKNKCCTEKIIRGVYKQPKESIIWRYSLEENLKKWGNDYYENISSNINRTIEKGGKYCPVAKTIKL